MSAMAGYAVKPIIQEYNSLCKTWNVTGLAVSALIKKLVIIDLEAPEVPVAVRDFVKLELEARFQRLFTELVECHRQLTQPDLNYKLEVALLKAHTELENAAGEIDEAALVLYETGLEVSGEIESLVKINVVELVNTVRADCQRHHRKIVDLTTFLESQLEAKLHRNVFLF